MIFSLKNRVAIVAGGLFLLGLLLFVFSASRFQIARKQGSPNQKVQVVATIYPLGDFAKNVGGELVEVTTITPPGVEPHEYEPTPQDLVKMQKADLVLMNGNGLDSWAEKVVDGLRAEQVRVLVLSEGIAVLPSEEGAGLDPHVWLDPVFAIQISEKIASALSQGSPDADQLTAQKEAYVARLKALDEAYQAGLARCERREIVTSHNAFRYLAKRYSLTNYYILGLSPEEDPSPQKIAEVSTLAKQKGVKAIFFETLVSPKFAETVASEVGVGTAVLNPIEGLTEEELQSGKDYLKVMEENLRELRTALTCV